ncbi:hypothetical protein PG993_014545 [Apiospora rasikravindrae]|uniref:F-box domain-containing protein n=1 Tax=Apiospora rasikravindrae TaxID=990691 RepID=A0ABR1RP56_9PEZI
MDNGYCLYIERPSTSRIIVTGHESYDVVPGDRKAERLPTSEQEARGFFLESPWSQGEHFKNHTWTTWLGGPEFGPTAHVDPSNGMYYCRQVPVQESLIKRGLIARPQLEDMEREVRKFNISLNPNIHMPRTLPWKCTDDREEPTPEELVALRLAHFPQCPRPRYQGKLTAPMVLSGNAFKIPTNSEICPFEEVMAIPELREKILEHHLGRWLALSNLARTSQTMLKHLEATFSHWDLTNQWFGGCDLTLDVFEDRKYRGGWSKQQKTQAKRMLQIIHDNDMDTKEKRKQKEKFLDSTKYVSVHPSRQRQQFGKKTLSGQMIPGTQWYDHSDSTPDPMNEDPVLKGESHISLLRSIYRHGTNIRYLHLHRVPFLNVDAVKAMMNSLPNLRVLGIYSCDLLNFSHTKDLLNIVIEANRVNAARPAIDFDYYPRFYRGPVEDRVGSYGVFWNDEGGFKTTLAVAASLLSIMRVAKEGSINLATSRDKAFYKWLNDFPWEFCTLPVILASIARILGFEGKYPDMIKEHYKERFGNQWKDHLVMIPSQQVILERTLHMDFYIAVLGSPQRQTLMDAMNFFTCCNCDETLFAGFFRAGEALKSPDKRTCHGCDLGFALQQPKHNFMECKRLIAALPWTRRLSTVDNLKTIFGREHKPGPTSASHVTKSVLDACKYLRDEATHVAEEKLTHWEQRHQELIEEKRTFTMQWQHRAQDKQMNEAREQINECLTTLGEQVLPATKTPEANNWDEMRRQYCQRLALQTGRLGNLGPHMGLGWEKWL